MQTLLLNHVTWSAAGHAVEALEITRSFAVNKNLKISVMLTNKTVYQLVEPCPWIENVYPIDTNQVNTYGENAKTYENIPKKWDIIIDDHREFQWESVLAHHEVSKKIFKADFRGCVYGEWSIPKNLSYGDKNPRFISLPQQHLDNIDKFVKDGVNIAILPGSSRNQNCNFPVGAWERIINNIHKNFDCHIWLTGKTKGKSTTPAYNLRDIERLTRHPKTHNMYDIEMLDQAALFQRCDLLISPHTGFSFIALYVDTPWLELAGGDWQRYIYNNLPFYTVFPDDKKFPHQGTFPQEVKSSCYSEKAIIDKMPEILRGVTLLLDKNFTYSKSKEVYKQSAEKAGVRIDLLGIDYI
jgi:ADP-heptose:LPS heptosyltransferase